MMEFQLDLIVAQVLFLKGHHFSETERLEIGMFKTSLPSNATDSWSFTHF